jgi:hypothetical protein
VIYLTLSMPLAVRALSLLLIVWFTTAASFPPCCWSIAGAHDHHAQKQASAPSIEAHGHHHDGSDLVALSVDAPLMSATPAHNCDTAAVEALVTPRTLLSFIVLLGACAPSADIVALQVPATWCEQSESVPRGGSPASAFLNPLRI